jgi:hypothetical protein
MAPGGHILKSVVSEVNLSMGRLVIGAGDDLTFEMTHFANLGRTITTSCGVKQSISGSTCD